jgi:nitroreductase/NAD-dependent dihydropyrimidine dehydrogenase PreA subunit
VVDLEKKACVPCGLCADHCPLALIGRDAEGYPCFRQDGEPCLQCGHCVAVCPGAALSLPELPAEPARPELFPTGPGMIAFLEALRSVRVFESRPVPRELLTRALDAARFAPSAKNRQPVEWAVLEDPAKVRTLAARFLAGFRSNPLVQDRHVAEGGDPVFRGAPHLALAHTARGTIWEGDAVIAATYFQLAAAALGLGTCWSGTMLPIAGGAAAALKAAAGIPEDHVLGAVVMIGYPRDSFPRVPGRRPLRVQWV